jgi:hypothetical protein
VALTTLFIIFLAIYVGEYVLKMLHGSLNLISQHRHLDPQTLNVTISRSFGFLNCSF